MNIDDKDNLLAQSSAPVATASLFTLPVALDAASELAREIDKLSWTI